MTEYNQVLESYPKIKSANEQKKLILACFASRYAQKIDEKGLT